MVKYFILLSVAKVFWIWTHFVWLECLWTHVLCKPCQISKLKCFLSRLAIVFPQFIRRQVLSREWRCSWSSDDRRCANCIWVICKFIAYEASSYIRYLGVLSLSPGERQRIVSVSAKHYQMTNQIINKISLCDFGMLPTHVLYLYCCCWMKYLVIFCRNILRFDLVWMEYHGLFTGSSLFPRYIYIWVVELMLGSVFMIELDTGLAGIYFHRYCTEYDLCHKQNT